MIIKIIGNNHQDLLTMYHNTILALYEAEISAEVFLSSDEQDCQTYKLRHTPALIVDDIVMTQGYVSDKKDLKILFQQQKLVID